MLDSSRAALCHRFCSLFLWKEFLGAVRGQRGSGLGATGFHLVDDVVLLAPSSQDLQHVLGWFAAKCEVAGMNLQGSRWEKGGLLPLGWGRVPASSGGVFIS